MFSQSYSKSIFVAQDLRKELSELRAQLGQLKQQKNDTKNRGEKISLGRKIKKVETQIDVIEEELKDAPPEPMNPKHFLYEVCRNLAFLLQKEKETKAEFIETMQTNAQYALEWMSEDLVKSEVKGSFARNVLRMIKQEKDNGHYAQLVKYNEIFNEYQKRTQGDLVDQVRWGIGKSSGRSHNMVEHFKYMAQAELIGDTFGGYGVRDYKMDKAKAWQILNEGR
jgi:predicted nuclease with TOPRIM domain